MAFSTRNTSSWERAFDDLLREDEFASPCNYMDYRYNLQTFNDWPANHPIPPKKLAEAGFYHDKSDPDNRDCCRCRTCKVRIAKWKKGDDPLYEHALWSSRCPFIRSAEESRRERRAKILRDIERLEDAQEFYKKRNLAGVVISTGLGILGSSAATAFTILTGGVGGVAVAALGGVTVGAGFGTGFGFRLKRTIQDREYEQAIALKLKELKKI